MVVESKGPTYRLTASISGKVGTYIVEAAAASTQEEEGGFRNNGNHKSLSVPFTEQTE